MPYPIDTATNKHDLVCPPLPPEPASLLDDLGFSNTAALFQALEKELPTNLKTLCPVYSYPNAPKPPMSRGLMVIGVADASLSVVRKLVGDEDDIPDCLHQCSVAVKRADGNYASQLKPGDKRNAQNFARFMRRLHKEGIVAILGQDKYHRFGILKPTDDFSGGDNDNFEAQDFAAACFVGRVDKVKEYLTQGISRPPKTSAPQSFVDEPPPTPPSTDGLWQPPGAEATNGDAAAGLWQPPGADDSNGDAGLWQPPGASNDDNADMGFGWQPPTDGDNAAGDFGAIPTDAAAADPWAPNEANDEDKMEEDEGNKFHADSGAAAADKFYSGLTRTLDTRANSKLYHMRAFNGWVKGTQIQELDPRTGAGRGPMRILDLACGKGGDLGKWTLHSRGLQNYVGIDVARGSLMDAAIRARKMRQKLKRCTFSCADLGSDVPGRLKSTKHKHMQKLLTWSLQNEPEFTAGDPEFRMLRGGGISLEDRFDVVSIQFAIHYMMQTRERARRFFQTVSQLLEVGGNLIATTIDSRVVFEHLSNLGLNLHFDDGDELMEPAIIAVGGGACRIRFEPDIVKKIFMETKDLSTHLDENLFGLEYTFTLVEGSDHASGVGDAVNLPEWLIPIPVLEVLAKEAGLELEYAQNFHEFYAHRKDPNTYASAHSTMYNMKVLNRNGSISGEEWEISRLYCAIKFRKVSETTRFFSEEDEEEEDDEPEEIDPKIKAKFLPMALMKAKKAAGNDVWNSLSSEEKNKLTEIELRKMAPK